MTARFHLRLRLLGAPIAFLLALTSSAVTLGGSALAASCANAIVCENQLPGTDPSVWDLSGPSNPNLQGFTTDISYNVGQTVSFKIKSSLSAYSIDIYRMGYYQGKGARKVASVTPTAPQSQPACLTNAPTGLVDCGSWAVTATWPIPATAVSGIYFARLYPASGAASQIVFVVRNDSSHSDIVFRTDDTTWQAYNAYGGNSLYHGSAPSSDGRAYKVSYNRPLADRDQDGGDGVTNQVFYAEYPMVRWLEGNGYDVSYMSAVDSDRLGSNILNHKVFLTAGHDEYWSAGMRSNVEAARDAGVNMAFFTGNEVFWKVRFENSIDGSGTAYRTLVCYKETKAEQALDPQDPPTWTGTWRDPTLSPPADGGKPENALNGTIFMVNRGSTALQVPFAYSRLRFWRNTPVSQIGSGQTATLGQQTIGYEWDEDLDNGFRPAGLMRLSSTTASVDELLVDYGNTYVPGTATHNLTLYRAASGALVFGAGTVQWSWGLDTEHDVSPDIGPAQPDPSMSQATVNLLADMSVQPASLQAPLTAATKSTDTTAPSSHVSSPSAGATFTSGTTVTVSGTASDSGGAVAGVEVSVDGGSTWHPATSGTTSWTYSWRTGAPGSTTIKSRAVDDSGNLETPSAGVTVTVNPRTCPCTLFASNSGPVQASANDTNAVEVGVKFKADQDGYVNGIKFYKGSGNTGTHVGNLWTSTGTLVASGTFTNETASGWQTLTFPTPVAITGNTVYVASYHTDTGHYASDAGGFTNADDVWPLHGLSSGSSGGNGVFAYGPSAFPTQSFAASNYWVDVVYNTNFVDTVAPSVTIVSPVPNATNASFSTPVTAKFNKSVVASSINFTLSAGGNQVPGSVSYDDSKFTATFTPNATLAQGTTFTATVSGATDKSGNTMTAPFTWQFTTMTCPCTLWPSSTTPGTVDSGDTQPVELGVRFTSDVNGYINGIRFYKAAANSGTHIGNLWTAGGQLLATATFTGETASGWQQVLFPTPVAVTANTQYIASYHTNAGHYAVNGGYFGNVDNSPLHAPASAQGAGNGLYAYGGSAFPSNSYNASNYWVDAVFYPTLVDTVAPTVTSTSPAANATQVPNSTAAAATFSEPVNAASISFSLSGPSGNVPGTLTYNSSTRTAQLQPSSALAANTTFTATVSGAKDSSNNTMAPFSWSFTTAAACPCTIFGSTNPNVGLSNDGQQLELGVKFRTSIDGNITAIRFYKAAGNGGAHTAHLWSSSGQLLATATFTGETASGWQVVTLPTPVHVTANTTYIASYHSDAGGYSGTGGYFGGSGAGGWPVSALADGVDGGNGVFLYGPTGFPNNSWNGGNYWVDVVFSP